VQSAEKQLHASQDGSRKNLRAVYRCPGALTPKEHTMPKYLMETTYTPEGVRALHKDKASARREAVVKLLQSVDGKLEAFYYAMGERDVIAIVELPDATAAAAVSLTGSATGMYRVTTTPLLSVEEVDRALARKLTIRAPGQ
jgi:uncharacterized protein with GYD domain